MRLLLQILHRDRNDRPFFPELLDIISMLRQHPVRYTMGDNIYRAAECRFQVIFVQLAVRVEMEVPVNAGYGFDIG